MSVSCAVVVGREGDPLAEGVATLLVDRGITVRAVAAPDLALSRLTLTATGARLEGEDVDAIFFRASPESILSMGFDSRDASFSSSETAAAWLAATGDPRIACLNRWDPDLWYTGSEWTVWRRRLELAGAPLSPLAVGACGNAEDARWIQWAGGVSQPPGAEAQRCFLAALAPSADVDRTVWCAGECISGRPDETARVATQVLSSYGAELVEVLAGPGGVVACGANPEVPAPATPGAARRIAEALLARMRGR